MIRLPTVVLVDDSADVRALIRSQIRLSGRLDVVGEGTNGLDAAALANRLRPDLMLLDVSMPVVDGLAALPQVLEVSPGTRVVMYTGFEEAGLADRARDLGAAAFLEKSVPVDVLIDTMVRLAGGPAEGEDEVEEPAEQPAGLDPLLADHLERFREVFEDAAIGMATMTLSGRLVRANRSLAHLLHRPVSSLVGLALADLAADKEAFDEAFDQLDAGEPAVQVEHRVAGDPERLFRSTLSPVIDARGRPLYLFLQVQDVSLQVAAEAELRRAEARFRLLVEAVEDYAIFMLDPHGYISSWNPGAQRTEGYTAEEIIGQHFRVFYPAEQQQARHPEYELEQALANGAYEEEGWRIRKDGTRFWASVTITAVREPGGELVGFAKVTRDTTERRKLADMAEQQAEFFAVTAHELRTPVGVLTGAASTIARRGNELPAEDLEELAAAVSRSSAQLRRLLDDLLTAARLQARRLALVTEVVDLEEQVHAVVTAAAQSAQDARIRADVEPGLKVHADPTRLAQMLDNLVTNALRHGRPPVEITATGRGSSAEIVVRDHGEGVTEEMRTRLFERFATGSAHGTGLGLFLVRELARAHGGDASYRSGDGAFVLSLPRR
ncbi:MAG: PAS domain S-box protein [Nocardioidaceae bacterium]|nr:PAS domain S-box protein [Nocardioidaceae bacterium]